MSKESLAEAVEAAEGREALEALEASEGWLILQQAVGAVHSPQKVLADLLEVTEKTIDMQAIGALAVARLNAYKAAQGVLVLPAHIIDIYRRREAEDAAEPEGDGE